MSYTKSNYKHTIDSLSSVLYALHSNKKLIAKFIRYITKQPVKYQLETFALELLLALYLRSSFLTT